LTNLQLQRYAQALTPVILCLKGWKLSVAVEKQKKEFMLMKTSFQFQFLEPKAFDTRIKSANVKNVERWIGFCLAPALVAMVNMLVGYLNVFYTDVLDMSPIAGGLFLAAMPLISKILDAITNIIMGRFIDNTTSRHGKIRPWLWVSGPLMAVSTFLLFACPTSSVTIKVVWATMSYNLYYCIAFTIYNISNTLFIPLSTRNSKQRDTLAMAYSVGYNMIPGMIASLLLPMLILPYMGTDQSKWLLVMSIVGVLAIPATILQYYFTRERITEESAAVSFDKPKYSLLKQAKGCLSSNYWVVIMAIIVVYWVYNNFQLVNLVYYCNWVLGTYNDGRTLTILQVVGNFPLGVGVLILWPLVKKLGKRSVMMVGCILAIVGNTICLFAPRDLFIVLGGMVLGAFGALPITYVLQSMLADALDNVEWKNGFRCDGFSAAVFSIVITVSHGLATGVFNLFLGLFGYVAPAADGSFVAQNSAVQGLFIAGKFAVPVAGLFIIAILLAFHNEEKRLPKMQAEIQARHIAEAKARGEEYISQDELARIEQEEQERIAEAKRVEELKEKCVKKNLDFETENNKHLAKLAAKQAKAKV
jgi:GPH family glycoside/pentoside/hexuronide:cation symporter